MWPQLSFSHKKNVFPSSALNSRVLLCDDDERGEKEAKTKKKQKKIFLSPLFVIIIVILSFKTPSLFIVHATWKIQIYREKNSKHHHHRWESLQRIVKEKCINFQDANSKTFTSGVFRAQQAQFCWSSTLISDRIKWREKKHHFFLVKTSRLCEKFKNVMK